MATTALLHRSARPPQVVAPSRPSLLVRLRVCVGRIELDRHLAAGADPSATPELAHRARQLTGRRERQVCIAGIERALRQATTPPGAGLTARAPVQRDAILAARPFLEHLLDRLRETDAPRPQGVARAGLLLVDGCGPLYAPAPRGALAAAAYRAADAL
jgi:hypothetical protein